MSEYWVSKKKYYCKYCEIYIADDAPSRSQHENGLKHKGNLERYIRGIYKAGEKRKKDQEEEKREMARVEQAAQIAYSQDLGSGRAKGGSSSAPTPSTSAAKKPPAKPSNPWANYSTAKSLGYEDPDAERVIADVLMRRTTGEVGEWEVVVPQEPTEPTVGVPSEAEGSVAGVKRPAEALAEEENREFKLRKKTMATGLGQIYDPGSLQIKLKKREEPVEADPTPAPPPAPVKDAPSDGPKWKKPQWQEAEVDESVFQPDAIQESLDVKPKVEEPPLGDAVKQEPDLEPPIASGPVEAVVFKKRKVPAGASRGRR
ncbi:Formin binding [Mycena kentingensis (nom. inval.)]|nr:Formin binding [Mycena kentingensis (nom. inval.)]